MPFSVRLILPGRLPADLTDVRQALAGLEERERVHFIFISVDPERDTPEVLERYVTAFDPSFIGLSDDFAKVEAVMPDYGAFAANQFST